MLLVGRQVVGVIKRNPRRNERQRRDDDSLSFSFRKIGHALGSGIYQKGAMDQHRSRPYPDQKWGGVFQQPIVYFTSDNFEEWILDLLGIMWAEIKQRKHPA